VARSTLPRIPLDKIGLRFLAYASKVELPAQGLSDLDDDSLQKLETDALAAFDEILSKDDPSDDDLAEAERLAGIVTDVREELGGRKEAVDGRRNRLNALKDKVSTPEGDDDDSGEDDSGEDDADDETPPPADGDVIEGDVVEDDKALVASGRPAGGARTRVRAADVGGGQTKPRPPANRKPIALTAAADVPDVRQGSEYDGVGAVADAVVRRVSEYPTTIMPGQQRVRMRNGIAVLKKDYEPELTAREVTDHQVLEAAANQKRLPGGSLVAAGGWCAPSETLYDLAEYEAADGLIDLPEINVRRGGIRFTPGPDFRSIYDGTGFSQTEAQAIAGETKPCYRVPCPPFSEVRAGVEGLCITSGILQNIAYPELTARVVRGALASHAHRISAKTIARMVTLSTDVTDMVVIGSGAAAPTLNTIELAVWDIKYRHRMAVNTTLEAVFPLWVYSAVRADLAKQGGKEQYNVTDAEIRAWFVARGIVPQFIYDWQDTGLGGATAAAAWPTTLSFLVYPAGTFVRGMGDVISLDTIYDSAGLVENEFTGLFTEESLLVAKLGHESRMYTVPIRPDGWTNAGYGTPAAPGTHPASGV
jgi:hypothetical protein